MKKALRKLVPAIVMLLVAAAFVGTSTYAWFSMNRTVDVTGMSVTTEVSDFLLISATNADAASYTTSLTQTREGKLRPVSSKDGVSFFYTGSSNVGADGTARSASYTAYSEAETQSGDPTPTVDNALTNTNAGKDHFDKGFNVAYGAGTTPTTSTVLYGYIDYVFYIRADNVTSGTEYLTLTNLNLLYHGAAMTDEKAWRVAVFSQAATEYTTTGETAITSSDCKAILAVTGAAYNTTGKAVASASSVDTVSPLASANWNLGSVTSGNHGYFKVTVRLWLEGEDTTCTNATYASLTEAYTLDLSFELAGASAGAAVLVIGSTAA